MNTPLESFNTALILCPSGDYIKKNIPLGAIWHRSLPLNSRPLNLTGQLAIFNVGISMDINWNILKRFKLC